jgi:hypothetical protein
LLKIKVKINVSLKRYKDLSTCKHLTMKRWRFGQEELKVVPKGKSLTMKKIKGR